MVWGAGPDPGATARRGAWGVAAPREDTVLLQCMRPSVIFCDVFPHMQKGESNSWFGREFTAFRKMFNIGESVIGFDAHPPPTFDHTMSQNSSR